ncbi:helix-turn-helix domain-containing protein [Halorientalis halophila]|uniref:helix-turn-helix domain-containing protein n=1 Tax=Halorientalis halophila TaxID=3108499 RepID=UPI00300839FD
MKATDIRLEPPGGAFPGVDDTLAETPGVTRDAVLNIEWMDDGGLSVLYRLGADEPATVRDALDSDETVREYEIVETDGPWLYAFILAERSDLMGELLDIADEFTLVIDGPFEWTDEGVDITVAGRMEDIQRAHARASEHFDLTIDRLREYEPAHVGPLAQLTDRQREALRTAYELGFYETPRRTSYEEIATELGCVPSTANDLLRRTEARLVGAVLDP